MEHHNLVIIFLLTIVAGASTGVGGLFTFVSRQTNRAFMAFSLGLAAGVLLFVSAVEIFPEALHSFAVQTDIKTAWLYTLLAFSGGIAVMGLIDMLLPHQVTVHAEAESEDMLLKKKLKKMSFLVALAVTLHNIPEGIAMFTVGISNYKLAFPILLAIIIHNIPIGISIAMPMYHATGNRIKALGLALAAGLATPAGAFLAWLVLLPYWSLVLNGTVLGAVSATMAYIAISELIPTARHYGKNRYAKAGFISGMVLVVITLWLT